MLTYSKEAEEKIKILVDHLVQGCADEGELISEATQSRLKLLLWRLAEFQERGAYDRANARLMANQCAEIIGCKLKLNEILIEQKKALPWPPRPVPQPHPPYPHVVQNSQPVQAVTLNSSSGRSTTSWNKTAAKLLKRGQANKPGQDLFVLQAKPEIKDDAWVDLLIDEVLAAFARDCGAQLHQGLERLLVMRTHLEEKALHTDGDTVEYSEIATWISALNDIILQSRSLSLSERCQHYEWRQHMIHEALHKHVQGFPLPEVMKRYPEFYADEGSLLEDVIDISEYHILYLPEEGIHIDNSMALARIYHILRQVIDQDRNTERDPAQKYVRGPLLKLAICEIHMILRTFIREIDAKGYSIYGQDAVRDAIAACYLAKIKIFNYEASKSGLHEVSIIKYRNALIEITEYILDRLQYGQYHTWLGGFFDKICAYVNWAPNCTRYAKLFAAQHLFSRIAEGSRYQPMSAEDSAFCQKTLSNGRLGQIKEKHQINLS